MPEVNFNLLNPNAELYSGPQVQMDPVAAYEKAKATRQSNMLAQLYAKHYDPQTGGVNYNALIPEAAQSGLDVSQLMPDVQKQQVSQAQQRQYETTAAAKQQEIDQAKMKQLATESYGRFRSVKNADDLLAWHLANPELPGTNKAERTARLQAQLAQPGGYEAARSEIEAALQDITGIKADESKVPKPEKVDVGGSIKIIDMNPNSQTYMKEIKSLTKTQTPAQAGTGTTQIPKLKQGERWNPTQERVEQVPGSAEYIKQSKLHGTDYGAVQAVNSKTELADKQIDRLLSPANEDAFNNLFGGYGAYVTQQFSGKTADLKSDLDSLKQNLKSAGLELIKSGGGGAIGTITEREWPILEGMIESLSPKMSESDAKAKLEAIKAKMANIRAMAADKYDTTWGETQYYKGASSAPAAGGGAQTTPQVGEVRKGYKFKGGNPSDANNWEKVK